MRQAEVKLWVLRHAKSDWSRAVPDFDRDLNDRGERNAEALRIWLAEQDHLPERILTSPAVRAARTAEVARRACPEVDFVQDPRIYHGDAYSMLRVVNEVEDEIESLLIAGHNPGITYFVNRLGQTAVIDLFPTCALARFSVSCPWRDLDFGNATLDYLRTPKGGVR